MGQVSVPYWLQTLLLSLAMFTSTFLLAMLPLKVKFSQNGIRYAQIAGAGLLVGAAVLIIIPEGIIVLLSYYLDKSGKPGITGQVEHN